MDNDTVSGRPLAGQPAGGPADLSPQAVSALSGAHQAHVTREDVIAFLENAFRNIALPPLDRHDVEDIRRGLQQFVTAKGGAA